LRLSEGVRICHSAFLKAIFSKSEYDLTCLRESQAQLT
jgi:hypothetical protein